MDETPSHRVSDPYREPRGGALGEQSTTALDSEALGFRVTRRGDERPI
jgi:hypothetical protein